MSKGTLYDKIFDGNVVADLPTGEKQLFVDLMYIHEVTSAPAFNNLRKKGLKALFPDRMIATCDHTTPTDTIERPFYTPEDERLISELEKNCKEFGIGLFDYSSGRQGIVHIIGLELGVTQPGYVIVCGDSHTSTHGALGALAFAIGTTEVEDVLVTQSLVMSKSKVRQIYAYGGFPDGTYPKDLILGIIHELGVGGGKGFTYEYAGPVFENMPIEGRATVCNMSIEGGARAGYVNPDQKVIDYLRGKDFVPRGEEFEKRAKKWLALRSDSDAVYDDIFKLNVSIIEPMVTWGTNPGQSTNISGVVPHPNTFPEDQRKSMSEALTYTGLESGMPMLGVPIDYVFFGSCTNARIEDLREGARYAKGRKLHPNVIGLVVPGSQKVKKQAEQEGLDRIFSEAGFQWRYAGCSMCLGMNPDQVPSQKRAVSTSNRNFEGRQGKGSRTILASPSLAVVSGIEGRLADPRQYTKGEI